MQDGSQDTQTPLPPERIGNYQRVGQSPLGVGGMGVVWLYRETGLSSREVAIKFIRPDENTELNKASLIKDIKAMEALPLQQNIIAMYNVIEEHGNIALVMEYVPGGITLKKVIKDNPNGLPIPTVKEILVGVLSGVAHAHEHGVIHRDIKPDNILMRQPKQGAEFNRNSAKIADFGISRVHRDGTRRFSTVVAFTEAYAAPEQINSEDTGGFTDVYAIGVVLYEMLAGRKPFEGKTSEIIIGHCHKPPPPINRADLPSGLKKMLDKALQKESAARYRDAIEMLAEYHALERMGELDDTYSPQTETTTPGGSTAYSQEQEYYAKTIVSGEKNKITEPVPPVQEDAAEKLGEEEAKRRAEEEARRNAEAEARRREEEAKRKAEKEARQRAEEEARRQADAEAWQGAEDHAKTIVSGEKKKAAPNPTAQAEAAAERRRAEEQAKREFDARRWAEEGARRNAKARKSELGPKNVIIIVAAVFLVALFFLRVLSMDSGSATPTLGSKDWAAVSAGSNRTVAIRTDGTLWAWGSNNSGQLGNGTKTRRSDPIQVGSAKNWATVSAGDGYTVALRTNGTLWAWGSNHSGQLGDGTKTDRSVPVQVGPDRDWAAVSAGDGYTVALKTDGTLWAWGRNDSGQLGDGTNTDRSVPVQVGSDRDWAAASAGRIIKNGFTVAVKKDGTLWAWGSNDSGQLGDGTKPSPDSRGTPVQVR